MTPEYENADRLNDPVALEKMHGVPADFDVGGHFIELHAVREIAGGYLDEVVGDPDPAGDRVLRVIESGHKDTLRFGEPEKQGDRNDASDAVADDIGTSGTDQDDRRVERPFEVDPLNRRFDRDEA